MADDLFDNERLQKMIALGIYDEEQVERMKRMSSKEPTTTSAPPKPPVQRPADRALQEVLGRPVGHSMDRLPYGQQMGRDFRGGPRGGRGRGDRGRGRGDRGGGGRVDRGWNPNQDGRFRPVPNTLVKWQEMGESSAKRPRNVMQENDREPFRGSDTFRSTIRDGIRDSIQTKIERNEIERKLNIDYMSERTASGKSHDTDFRAVSDTDSRKRDTDSRVRDTDERHNTTNQRNIAFTANRGDFGTHERRDIAAGDVPRSVPRSQGQANQGYNRPFSQGSAPASSSASTSASTKTSIIDDLDDFIANASKKLGYDSGERRGGRGGGRGRGGVPERPSRELHGHSREVPHNLSRDSEPHFVSRPDDPLGLRQPFDSYSETPDDEPEIIEVRKEPEQNPSKDIAILRDTVEELAKSNLYCQYCDCYLSSLSEVNAHIGTAIHQKNMHQKTMEEQNKSQSQTKPVTTRVSQTIVERVPVGMAAIVQMIEQKKQITLKSLTDMDSYEINSDSEAALAKELAKLLTNELLNYKMNLMPDQVKQAMKDHGIGIINSMMRN